MCARRRKLAHVSCLHRLRWDFRRTKTTPVDDCSAQIPVILGLRRRVSTDRRQAADEQQIA